MTATLAAPLAAAARRQLRDYQQQARDSLAADRARGLHRLGVVMATGLGKTDIIAAEAVDAAREGRRVLVLAHRAELIDQIIERCRMHAPDITVGRVQGAVRQHRRQIVVAMEPTMRNAKVRGRMLGPAAVYDLDGELVSPAGLVIVDECHHAASPKYMEVLRWAGCFPDPAHPDRQITDLVGVTATFTRGDKRGLGDVFESSALPGEEPRVSFERGIDWAVKHGPSDDDPLVSAPVGQGASHGWLVMPHGRVVVGEHVKLEQAKISKTTKDYADVELGEMVAQDVDHIVASWIEHARDRITAAFTPSIPASQALADAFRAAGVPVGEVYGTTKPAERHRIYDQLGRGVLRVLVGVGVMTEGWDCPPVSCVLMARPTKLPGLYAQIVGRGLRLLDPAVHPGHPPKTDCLVLDVVGASRTQRLITLVQLIPSAKVNRDEAEAQPCEVCGGYVKAPTVRAPEPCACTCPDCAELLLECQCGAGPRDPDGGRRRLKGPAKYADVDLLGPAVGSALNWLRTPGGVWFIGAGKHLAAVTLDRNGTTWTAGYCEAFGGKPGEDLVVSVTEDEARAAVEQWAEANGAHLRDAPWRRARKRPSEAAQQVAARLGIANPDRFTAGGLADEIDLARATKRFDR